jgi:hypothetical protein
MVNIENPYKMNFELLVNTISNTHPLSAAGEQGYQYFADFKKLAVWFLYG